MRYQLIAPRDEAMSAVEQVLHNRGIKLEDMERFKYPSQNDIVDPRQLKYIYEGRLLDVLLFLKITTIDNCGNGKNRLYYIDNENKGVDRHGFRNSKRTIQKP